MTDGPLSNPRVQKALKEEERRLRDWELADLETILGLREGRRFYYRLVFELGNLEGSSWFPAVKDGMSAALYSAQHEGVRWVGRTLAEEAQRHFPDLWRLLLNERLAREEADVARREQATKPSAGDDDE